jgi:hypothetical protein
MGSVRPYYGDPDQIPESLSSLKAVEIATITLPTIHQGTRIIENSLLSNMVHKSLISSKFSFVFKINFIGDFLEDKRIFVCEVCRNRYLWPYTQ